VIASVRGQVTAVRLDAVVVDVGGIGLLLQATPATLASQEIGRTTCLETSLVVREDCLTLYGFADAGERDTYEVLLSVSGIGPRLALAMLAVHSPDSLRAAVADEDVAALTRVPGIGRKGAQRLILELADRLGPPTGQPAAAGAPGRTPGPAAGIEQVVQALVGLGWQARAAERAVATVTGDGSPAAAAAQAGDVAGVLRAALRELGNS
jgi:holliday junction DNA helicase RuvA